MTTRLRVERCSSCSYLLDAASDPKSPGGRRKPKAGDISICLNCGHLSAFNVDLSRRELNSEEMYQVAGDPHILKIQAARAHVMKDKKP